MISDGSVYITLFRDPYVCAAIAEVKAIKRLRQITTMRQRPTTTPIAMIRKIEITREITTIKEIR
jgi:hypothetical protein